MSLNNAQIFDKLDMKTQSDKKDNMHNFDINLYHGIGEIQNEQTSMEDVVAIMGKPDSNREDDRGNKILVYPEAGLMFKFLKMFNDSNRNPILSFIKINRPFRSTNSVYPGLAKEQVHEIMSHEPHKSAEFVEIWRNDSDKYMKFTYDEENRLESIIIY